MKALLTITCLLVCCPELAQAWEWKSVSGQSVEAEYVKQSHGRVILKSPGGKQFSILLSRLSEADQAYVKSLSAKPGNSSVSSTPTQEGNSFAQGQKITYGRGRKIADLASGAIIESSGLACGRANKDVFWTHNDSGGRPRLFAFDLHGKELAVVSLTGAQSRDWEDMASFSHGGKHFLLVGDVGDNDAKREICTLYIVPEPKLSASKRSKTTSVTPIQTIHFRYEDGPHNCESVSMDPQTSVIYLVSKVNGNSCKVYSLPRPKRGSKKTGVAKAIAALDIPTTTAMDISPDGLRAIVLTYGHAFEFSRGPKETWDQGFSRPPRCIRMPQRVQGESISYGPDGKTIYLTSECERKDSSNPSPLLEVPVVESGKVEPNQEIQPTK